MEVICQAFMAKWGKVPLLDMYRQMAIRQQKLKDWEACRWWSERGLALYGNNAAREEAVEDLLKRRNRALAKLEAPVKPPKLKSSGFTVPAVVAETPAGNMTRALRVDSDIEVLVCGRCGMSFERVRVRGRKPLLCPGCRVQADDNREPATS
jgi:predicted Zn-ribbon and HTH transcriptional regulator